MIPTDSATTRKRPNRALSIGAIALLCALTAAACAPLAAVAVPPSPHALALAKKDPTVRRRMATQIASMRVRGIDGLTVKTFGPASSIVPRQRVSGPAYSVEASTGVAQLLAKASSSPAALSGAGEPAAVSSPVVYKQLVLLVDFSDKPGTVSSSFYDDLIFKDVTGPASVRGFYREVSAGKLDMQGVSAALPSVVGWLRMPHPYSWYVGTAYGTGSYATTSTATSGNSQNLYEDAAAAAKAKGVDFSQYDNDGNGTVDGVVMIHAGRGAEFTTLKTDIWSHKWQVTTQTTYNGKLLDSYTTEPEYWVTPGDLTVGVICHELGHAFGLPDLYDTSNKSQGLGQWSVMANGSWNGPNGRGASPARFDAYCLTKLGFATATNVSALVETETILPSTPTAEGTIVRVAKHAASGGTEYFLVENRRQANTDAYLPGAGLLVYHIDETRADNSDNTHYLVDIEEAHGGTQNLALPRTSGSFNMGDSGDPFPGLSGNRTFSDTTSPNARYYTGASGIKISEISASSTTMTAIVTPNVAASSLDTVPPVTISDVAPSYDGTATINLSATDASSGVASTSYRLDSGVTTKGTTVVAGKYGSHTLKFWSTDLVGNVEPSRTATFFVNDIDPPSASSNAVSAYWQTAAVRISASDGVNGSGITSIGYRVDGAATQTVSSAAATVSVTDAGPHTIDYWSSDAVGLSSDVKHASLTLSIDNAAPVTSNNATATYEGTATITLTPTDAGGSGVVLTSWLLDGVHGSGTQIVVPKIGNHVLQYWSTDLVGNVEVTTTVPFFVRDPLPPLVVCDVAGPYTSYATINIKATDPVNGSGVASISRQVDSEPTVTVAANTATFDCDVAGSHTITYWAIDKAGNSSTPVSAAFVVDPGTLVYISNKSRTVSAGAWVTIKGHIDAASAAVKPLGQFVVAQRLTATGWVSAGVADSPLWINGSYEFARIKVTRNTTFRVSTRPGSLLVLGHSKPLVLGAKAVLSTPKLSKPVPTAKKTFRVSGTVYPAHASTVVVSWYKVNSRGRRTLYSTPTTLALSSAGTWSQSKKLAHGRWAVKVTHADADHVSASSAYRTFSVH